MDRNIRLVFVLLELWFDPWLYPAVSVKHVDHGYAAVVRPCTMVTLHNAEPVVQYQYFGILLHFASLCRVYWKRRSLHLYDAVLHPTDLLTSTAYCSSVLPFSMSPATYPNQLGRTYIPLGSTKATLAFHFPGYRTTLTCQIGVAACCGGPQSWSPCLHDACPPSAVVLCHMCFRHSIFSE